MNASRTGILVSALPSLIMLALFYSLAFHMHQYYGGWPTSVGAHGFPPSLAAHALVAVSYCTGLGLAIAFVLPFAILVCLLVPKWRFVAPYLIMSGLLFIVSLGLMKLAPQEFLRWW